MEVRRLGNDMTITASITRKLLPEDFTGKNLTLVLWSDKTSFLIPHDRLRISNNQIIFTWFGKEQKHTGRYFITLYEEYGLLSQNVVDSKACVELVSYSFQTLPNGHRCRDIDSGDLQISITIDAMQTLTDYTQLTNKPSINGVTLEGDLSSEDLGLSGGGVGNVDYPPRGYIEDLIKDWDRYPNSETD